MRRVRLPLSPPIPRRELLRWAGALAATASLPAGCASEGTRYYGGYLTPGEKATLGALADAILPPDGDPGGKDLGVVDYVDRLLGAFDVAGATPPIYAGGPFSGRTPFPSADGTPSAEVPPDDFATWMPLDRVKDFGWRLRILGSEAVGGGPNDAVLGPTVGLRDQIRKGLASAVSLAGAPLETLPPDQVLSVFKSLDRDFQDLLVQLAVEGAFSDPVYGGNAGGAGWKMAHFEGDSAPLGYSQFDETTGAYVQRADAPDSLPNPGTDPDPLDADTLSILTTATLAKGGRVRS